MATDPSWLYSTIAQSSAAIVAIIGGFITASVLMLRSEKRSMEKQKSEKETYFEATSEKRKELQYIYDINEAEWFLKRELTNYTDDKIPTLEQIFAKYPSDYRKFFNKDTLQREYIRLSFKKIRAKFFILKHTDKIDITNYNSFLDWAKPNVSTKDYIEISKEYDKYIERQKKSESASNEASTLRDWTLPWNRNIIQNQLDIDRREREQKEEEKRRSRQDNISSGIEKLNDQLSLLNHELENLNSQLSAFQYPNGLGWGVIILAFLAVFSIFLPVLIMSKEAFFTWAKWLTTATFWLGIIGVFAYIVFQIRELRRK